LKNAGKTFQRKIQTVVRGINEKVGYESYLAYVDDLILYSETEEEHSNAVKIVLRVIKDHGLQLNENKCKYN